MAFRNVLGMAASLQGVLQSRPLQTHRVMYLKKLSYAVAGVALAAFAACSSPSYRYVPIEPNTQPTNPGPDTAVYALPAQQPQGQVRILSSGVVRIKSKQDGKELSAVLVRMVFSNQSPDSTWEIDSDEQIASFANAGQSKAVFVTTDQQSSQNLEVGPGQLRTWDLFFPLPGQDKEAKDIPAFDVHWVVHTSGIVVAQTTSFQRQRVPEAPAVVYPYEPYPVVLGFGYGYGWGGGPHYWARVR